MSREIITRHPHFAVIILTVGAAVYWLLCQPATWTRGYPRIDPFWHAMPWLWFVPVLVSAVLDDQRKRRTRTLIVFALFSGFVMAGTWRASVTPRRMSFSGMIVGTLIFGPVCLGATLLFERVWQRILWSIRQFSDDDRCRKCEYVIRHLTIARCPECGTPFDPQWLDRVEGSLEPTSRPWRTSVTVFILLAAGALFPFLFHVASIERAARSGRVTAMREWQAGKAALYFDYHRRTPFVAESVRPMDPLSGLPLRFLLSGLEREIFQDAYNTIIEAELAQAGRPCITQYVFSNEELEALMNEAAFRDIPELPYTFEGRIRFAEAPEGLTVNGSQVHMSSQILPRQFALLPEPAGLMILRTGNNACTLLSDGTPLQYVLTTPGADGKFIVLP